MPLTRSLRMFTALLGVGVVLGRRDGGKMAQVVAEGSACHDEFMSDLPFQRVPKPQRSAPDIHPPRQLVRGLMAMPPQPVCRLLCRLLCRHPPGTREDVLRRQS